MDELKKLIEAQNIAWKEYKDANEKRLQALAEGQSTSEINARMDRINADIDKLQKAIDHFSAKLEAQDRSGLGASDGDKVSQELKNWMRETAKGGNSKEFRAAATVGTPNTGGYTVIPELEKEIDRIASSNSVIYRLSRVMNIGTGSLEELISQGGAGGGWVAEGDARPVTNSPTMEKVTIKAEEVYAMPEASTALLEDSSIDIIKWLAEEAGTIIADLVNAAFFTGNGTAKPKGILGYTTVANSSYAWGNVGYVASGAAADFAAANPSDKLIDLIHSLKEKYRNNGSFIMADTTLSAIRKFKDNTNNYLWSPGLQAGAPSTLLGKPVYTDDFMPAVAANALAIAFADFKSAYKIVDRQGIKVLQDPYSHKGFVQFYTTKRIGGGIRNFEAIKLMKIAAT